MSVIAEINLGSCCCLGAECDDYCTISGERRWNNAIVQLGSFSGTWVQVNADQITIDASFDLSLLSGIHALPWSDSVGAYYKEIAGTNCVAKFFGVCPESNLASALDSGFSIEIHWGDPLALGFSIIYAVYGEGVIMPGRILHGHLSQAFNEGGSGIYAGAWPNMPTCTGGGMTGLMPTFPATPTYRVLPSSAFMNVPSFPTYMRETFSA